MVLNIQRKFSYLQSLPGIYTIQRPHHPNHSPQLDYTSVPRLMQATDDKQQMIGLEKQNYETSPTKPLYLGYNNTPQICSAEASSVWSIPPLLPSNLGPFFPKAPAPYYAPQGFDHDGVLLNSNSITIKSDGGHKLEGDGGAASFGDIGAVDVVKLEAGGGREEGAGEDGVVALGFELHRGAEKCCES